VAERPLFRHWLTLFLLLSFTLQSYIAQTHFHRPDAPSAASGHAPDRLPTKDDPANCPICQELLHSGQFVMPAAAALALPSASISIVAIVVAARPILRSASHSWQGRAPPAV